MVLLQAMGSDPIVVLLLYEPVTNIQLLGSDPIVALLLYDFKKLDTIRHLSIPFFLPTLDLMPFRHNIIG